MKYLLLILSILMLISGKILIASILLGVAAIVETLKGNKNG